MPPPRKSVAASSVTSVSVPSENEADAPPSTVPLWFSEALAVPFDDHFVEVNGSRIHYVAWGERGRRGLLFVHGGGAHAHWWTHIAALFAADHRVVALDLSGHGDSGRRDAYSLEEWTAEVMAVSDDAGFDGPPVIIGHSMGGMVTIATAAIYGADRLAGVIVCDSPVTEPDPEIGAARLGVFKKANTYASLDEAVTHFRTVPDQADNLPYVIDHVARMSLVQRDGGWQWKFDHTLFSAFTGDVRGAALPYLGQVHCRLALLRSEKGLVTVDIGQFMYERMGRITPIVSLPETGHHAMLDRPLLLTTAIRTLLADWDHSTPRRRDVVVP